MRRFTTFLWRATSWTDWDWTYAGDFDAVLLERAADGPRLVLSGEAEALWGGGGPGFEVVARGPRGGRFIGMLWLIFPSGDVAQP